MRNELFCINQKQSFHKLFTGSRDFFSLRSYTILSKCIEFCFGKIHTISKFRGMKNGSFYLIGESLNNFWLKQSNFCMKVERSNFILVPNSALSTNPNTIKSYKILQKLSPKHAAHGVAQSTYPNYRHGKACLSKQPPWRAAGDPRLARGRSRVRAPGPAGALRALFSPPSLPSSFRR